MRSGRRASAGGCRNGCPTGHVRHFVSARDVWTEMCIRSAGMGGKDTPEAVRKCRIPDPERGSEESSVMPRAADVLFPFRRRRNLPFTCSFGTMKRLHKGGYDGFSSHQTRASERDA